MATEDEPQPAIPPYPEMIMAAIDEMDDTNGSTKAAISQHIEGKYEGLLPPAHGSLLTAHLASMKESGGLVFSKNNYFRADAPSAPPKRGRGRPPKPKDPNAPPPKPKDPTAPTRGRGRPPKPKDPNAPKDAPTPSRGRGRPPKRSKPTAAASSRGRGRPAKKAKVATDPPARAAAAPASGDAPVKRGRGRPPKAKPAAE